MRLLSAIHGLGDFRGCMGVIDKRMRKMKLQNLAVKPGMSEVRFNWNVFPSTRLQESQIVTPVGCLYTPVICGSVPSVERCRTSSSRLS